MALEELQLIEQQMDQLDREIANLLSHYQDAVQRLAEVPGLGVNSAQQIIAEVGAAAATFPSEKHLASWVGVCPGQEYLLKESLERLWDYHYEGAMINYLQKWMDQLKWQRLKPFEELAAMLLKHLEGIMNYCRTKVRFGVVEAINANIRMLINRGRGYKNLRYLLLKVKRLAVTNVEFIAVRSMKKAA